MPDSNSILKCVGWFRTTEINPYGIELLVHGYPEEEPEAQATLNSDPALEGALDVDRIDAAWDIQKYDPPAKDGNVVIGGKVPGACNVISENIPTSIVWTLCRTELAFPSKKPTAC